MTWRDARLLVEAALVWLIYHGLRLLPLDAASAIGGWLGRVIGYRLPVTRRARRNLARALPALDEREREAILLRMWDNLGRVAGEYPHLEGMTFGPGQRVEVEGVEHIQAAREAGRGLICFSAHCGNWELLGVGSAKYGMPFHLVYRAPNNAHLDWLYHSRGNKGAEMLPKGARGARRALELLRQGGAIGMLVDQKMNDGVAAPFFGREAMTAPALAQFAMKYGCAVIPGHVERLDGARFRVVIEPPIAFARTGDRHADLVAAMTHVNRIVEGWIRRRPEQWLWLHRRWPE